LGKQQGKGKHEYIKELEDIFGLCMHSGDEQKYILWMDRIKLGLMTWVNWLECSTEVAMQEGVADDNDPISIYHVQTT